MRPFRVDLEVAGPIVLGPTGLLPTMDSVLAALLAKRDARRTAADPRAWTPEIPVPLAYIPFGDKKIYKASTLIPMTKMVFSFAILPRRRPVRKYWEWARPRRWEFASGAYVNRATGITTVTCRRWQWFAMGDSGVVRDLLTDLLSIGAHRGAGFGRVVRWDLVEIEHDESIIGPDGALRRPIPAEMAVNIGLSPDDPNLKAIYRTGSGGQPSWDPENWLVVLSPLPLTVRGGSW